MAKAKKLKSGNWRALAYSHTEVVDGKKKRIYESFTSPDKKEAEYKAAEFALTKKNKPKPIDMTLAEAIDAYIAKKDGILSPTTIAGYKTIKRNYFLPLQGLKLKDITRDNLENAVNTEAKKMSRRGKPLSPKTIANAYMFLVSVLKDYHPSLDADIKLPTPPNAIKEVLPPEIIFDIVRGDKIELPVLLAMWLSFSMSEILGLTKTESINGDFIKIQKVKVKVGKNVVIKDKPKVSARVRQHKIPGYIKQLIDELPAEQESLVVLSGHAIYDRWERLLKSNGLSHMTFHDLRHVNASAMAELGIPDKYAQERGGWKSDSTMKKVYQHTFSKARQEVDKKIDDYFLNKMQHEMQHEDKTTS